MTLLLAKAEDLQALPEDHARAGGVAACASQAEPGAAFDPRILFRTCCNTHGTKPKVPARCRAVTGAVNIDDVDEFGRTEDAVGNGTTLSECALIKAGLQGIMPKGVRGSLRREVRRFGHLV